jgi:oligoribonuclease NrnB/cAMP/cGMP phosphodiesterase (DHH superfamily)
MIVFHHNDMDGRCAAAIVRRSVVLREGERLVFKEVDYKDVIDVESIELEEKVFVVDFSFRPEVMEKVFNRTLDVVWIDHHSTAKAYDYGCELAGLRDFNEPSTRSGALLCWEYFWPQYPAPSTVNLVSDYDTWTHKLPGSVAFMEGLKMAAHGPTDAVWDELLGPDFYDVGARLIRNGRVAIEYRENYAGEMRKAFGYECEFAGEVCYALNAYRFGSLVFGEMINKYPMCIAYADDGNRTTVSVYSVDKSIHAGEICKEFGGGGHAGAAGFILEAGAERPWKRLD